MSSPSLSAYSFRQLDGPVADGSSLAGAGGLGGDPIATAHAEAERIRCAAREAGLNEGRAEAEASVRAQAAETLAALAHAVKSVHELREQYVAALEADALTIGLRLAEQIIAGAIEAEPTRLLEVAGLALRRLTDRRMVTLVVNPSELDLLSEATASLSAELGGIENLNVQSDRRVRRGGVIARTDAGEIDATIESQLERARELVALGLLGRDAAATPPADDADRVPG